MLTALIEKWHDNSNTSCFSSTGSNNTFQILVIAAIEAAGFDARIRPEALTLEDFAAVQRELK